MITLDLVQRFAQLAVTAIAAGAAWRGLSHSKQNGAGIQEIKVSVNGERDRMHSELTHARAVIQQNADEMRELRTVIKELRDRDRRGRSGDK